MCSTPRPKKSTVKRIYDNAIAHDMDQAAYSKMIQQANKAYEDRHPESTELLISTNRMVTQLDTEKKGFMYWLTQASLKELTCFISRHISFN